MNLGAYAFPPSPQTEEESSKLDFDESRLLTEVRQLTFEGRRAGEGYFSADGSQLVFQSERAEGNPFFQIYLMDLEFGDIEPISPGIGKTTCAWIHPHGETVLFASTHDDPDALQEQKDELELRASGKERRYSWDYDEYYDLYAYDRATMKYTNLTNTKGYDAEGSYSPDGELIAFASNRLAYSEEMTDEQRELFELDPASMMDIFIMNAEGTNVKRLTTSPGYDGGPFFSPDGKRICWRRFSENGATAEIMTMNIDGTDQTKLTSLGVMSWAPYYHPSGEYLIFTTNLHGFNNFELYLIDVAGKKKPVRVTTTEGFDGLPVFSPDGESLVWTTNRTSNKQSQLFTAAWNHEKASELLGITDETTVDTSEATRVAMEASRASRAEITTQDLMKHIDYLCSDQLAGRLTGTEGEQLATAYAAALFDDFGLVPAGDDGGWFQQFDFTAGVSLGEDNQLVAGEQQYELNEDWRPIAFSQTGSVEAAPIVFAGYGIAAPADDGQEEYDSYVHLDVKDKWVMVFRFMPEGISPERRQQLSRFASLRFKTMLLRDKGARGMIVVSGPTSKVKNQLVELRFDGSLSGASLPVISVTDEVAASWLKLADESLEELQTKLDSGDLMMGFEIPDATLAANIEIEQVKKTGRNVLARLQFGEQPSEQVVLIGAHIDHLGLGPSGSSLARDDEKGLIHYGADDNGSGTAVLFEIAQYLGAQKAKGWKPKRDILFACWSGEELGLLGASHFAKSWHAPGHGHGHHGGDAHGTPKHEKADPHKVPDQKAHAPVDSSLYPSIAACVNMDMVGRLDKNLVLQGIGSSSIWKSEVERRNVPVGLPITLQNDSYLPTDASVFFLRGVPIISAFTGSHSEYHTPRDTPDTLNYEGTAKIGKLMALITRSLAMRAEAPDYIPQERLESDRPRARMRAFLGTVPDYAAGDVKGVLLSGTAKGGPASKAGVKQGDVIIELAGKKVENIYDYTYAIEALKIGEETTITVQRGEKQVKMKIVPGSRD